MSLQSWVETLNSAQGDGTANTAGTAASCIPPYAKVLFPANYFQIGKMLRVFAMGRISSAVTTPGTARFDFRLGGTVVFDTGALNLNVVQKTNVPWWLDIILTCRAVGNAAVTTFMGIARFISEDVVGAPANTAGGNGVLLAPVGAPAVGTGVDGTGTLSGDLFFTQTLGTGSMTLHQYSIEAQN